MILPGYKIIPRIISNTRNSKIQTQPCGVDLTLKRIRAWKTAGTIDFDNSLREMAQTETVPFTLSHHLKNSKPKNSSLTQDAHAHEPATEESNATTLKIDGEESSSAEAARLSPGAYLIDFNETITTPRDAMGQLFVRSSLFRSGCLLSAGVMDSGYRGAIGGLLQVLNPHGVVLYRDARLAQMVFLGMAEEVEGYRGGFQGVREV